MACNAPSTPNTAPPRMTRIVMIDDRVFGLISDSLRELFIWSDGRGSRTRYLWNPPGLLPRAHLQNIVFINSLEPEGPVTRTITGSIFVPAVNSNARKRQHSRSAAINSSTAAIDTVSAGTRKAYPSGNSSVAITRDLN